MPYPVFADTNHALRAAQERIKALEADASQYGKAQVDELNAALLAEKANGATRVALLGAGVSQSYLDYMVGRYNGQPAEGRPDAGAWAAGLKEAEPAFFGLPRIVPSAAPASLPTTPTTSPDAGAVPSGGGQPPPTAPPLTHEAVATMTAAEYAKRRDEVMELYNQRR
ncbi:MAG: hypothetical protein GY925_26340 [Actinomycetia bacterium]|nr:hypothetical protein [Actinomycetes bacterium]